MLAPQDLITLYFKEMGQVSLLTAEEEITLAKRIENGRWAEKELVEAVDDSEEAHTLQSLIRRGHRARERLISANTRLVGRLPHGVEPPNAE